MSWRRFAGLGPICQLFVAVSWSYFIGQFGGLALMDSMKPHMPPTPENMKRVYRDIHSRKIEMWAGCIRVPIYEVMTRDAIVMPGQEKPRLTAVAEAKDMPCSVEAAWRRHAR